MFIWLFIGSHANAETNKNIQSNDGAIHKIAIIFQNLNHKPSETDKEKLNKIQRTGR